MALTQEQIDKLKPYDTLILNNYPISYLGTYTSGIIGVIDDKAEACCNTRCLFPQQYLSLPPKHDHTRLFKKGDEVRVVKWNGRDIARMGQIGRVVSDEHNSRVELAIDGWTSSVYYPACHLELITPVEEFEPYSIDPANTNVLFKHGKKFATFEDDDEAQEICSRLNAEYRKEQK